MKFIKNENYFVHLILTYVCNYKWFFTFTRIAIHKYWWYLYGSIKWSASCILPLSLVLLTLLVSKQPFLMWFIEWRFSFELKHLLKEINNLWSNKRVTKTKILLFYSLRKICFFHHWLWTVFCRVFSLRLFWVLLCSDCWFVIVAFWTCHHDMSVNLKFNGLILYRNYH